MLEGELQRMAAGIQLAIKQIVKKNNTFVGSIIYKNNNRHALVRTPAGNFYILFKREFFMTYGKLFSGESGVGETINKEFLDYALENNALLLFVYPNGSIYSITPGEFKKYAEDHETIRMTESLETTYSIPVSLLRRWDEKI